MKADNPAKHFILAFVLALIIYVVFYRGIEYRRVRKGPWQVTFTNNSSGEPALIIHQPWLAITNVEIDFAGETLAGTNQTGTLVFRNPRPVPYDVPFGKCIFMDLTFLPGTLTFNLYGHEIELLPRVLMMDHEEYPWRAGASFNLRPAREERVQPR
jgi:hypothetical protein